MKTVSIPAAINGTPGSHFERTGNDTVFSCVSSSGPCQVQIGNQRPQSCIAGLVLGDPASAPLGSITFLNFGAVAVDVTFDSGTTAYKGATPTAPSENLINLPIFGAAGSLGGTRALPTGQGVPIGGTQVINGVSKTRQWIEISNFSATDDIYVYINHGNPLDQCIGSVFPRTFRRFDVSKDLVLVNISANVIQCTAYEQY
jgi:hypothetical protein